MNAKYYMLWHEYILHDRTKFSKEEKCDILFSKPKYTSSNISTRPYEMQLNFSTILEIIV